MKNNDAAKLLNLEGDITPELVKKAYRKASSKYHPDKGGSKEMMQAVNEAYDTLKDFSGSVEAGDMSYPDSLNEAINKIIDLEDIVIEVCGAWVWVTGETKKHARKLGKKEGGAGFTWAKKKSDMSAWFYRPSDWKSKSYGKFSLDEIRENHGSEKINRKGPYKLAST